MLIAINSEKAMLWSATLKVTAKHGFFNNYKQSEKCHTLH